MKIRCAVKSDSDFITKIFEDYKFKLDPRHLEYIAIAENEDGSPIAIMSLNTVLEASFLTVPDAPIRSRIEALKRLVSVGANTARDLDYDLVHAFANSNIKSILQKHFGFFLGEGTNLVKFVGKE